MDVIAEMKALLEFAHLRWIGGEPTITSTTLYWWCSPHRGPYIAADPQSSDDELVAQAAVVQNATGLAEGYHPNLGRVEYVMDQPPRTHIDYTITYPSSPLGAQGANS